MIVEAAEGKMTGEERKVLRAIRDLYEAADWARTLFDWLAARKNNPASTPIERLTGLLDMSLSEATACAKQLHETGCGEYIVGRRGGTSRFEWAYNAISLGQVASRQADELVGLNDDEDDPGEHMREEETHVEGPLTLTIVQAKEALARTFGVKPEQIEIIIKA